MFKAPNLPEEPVISWVKISPHFLLQSRLQGNNHEGKQTNICTLICSCLLCKYKILEITMEV